MANHKDCVFLAIGKCASPYTENTECIGDQCAMASPRSPVEEATSGQIGGNHYIKLKIQPMEYSFRNHLDCLQHTIIKYVTRFRDKGGREDLLKARHCIDMLIQFEYDDKD